MILGTRTAVKEDNFLRVLMFWHLWNLSFAEADASPDASAFCYRLSENIGILAVVVPKLKFRQVQRQIFPAHVVIRADNTTFQQTPEVINVIGMNHAAHVIHGLGA